MPAFRSRKSGDLPWGPRRKTSSRGGVAGQAGRNCAKRGPACIEPLPRGVAVGGRVAGSGRVRAGALPFRSSGRQLQSEALEAGSDAVGDQADLAQVAHQPVMQVAAEVLAEGGLVAARRPLAAELLDLVELALAEAQLLVDREREGAGERAAERPHREVLHLAML